MNKIIFLSIVLLFTQSCSTLKEKSVGNKNESIKISLFKHLLSQQNTKHKNSLSLKSHYFLSDEKNDPSIEIIQKLNNSGYKVYPKSYSKVQPEKLVVKVLNEKQDVIRTMDLFGTLRHKELGGLGTLFGLGKIKWVSKNKVTISWNSYLSGLNASANIATLQLKNGKWVVTK